MASHRAGRPRSQLGASRPSAPGAVPTQLLLLPQSPLRPTHPKARCRLSRSSCGLTRAPSASLGVPGSVLEGAEGKGEPAGFHGVRNNEQAGAGWAGDLSPPTGPRPQGDPAASLCLSRPFCAPRLMAGLSAGTFSAAEGHPRSSGPCQVCLGKVPALSTLQGGARRDWTSAALALEELLGVPGCHPAPQDRASPASCPLAVTYIQRPP